MREIVTPAARRQFSRELPPHIFRRNIFAEPERDARRALSAHRLGLYSVLAAEANRGGVVVQLLELHAEALADREHDGGEQRAAVGIVESIEGSAEPIIAQVPKILLSEAVHGWGEAVHGLDLAIDRLALDHDRAKQYPQCCGVWHRAASIGRRDVLIQQLDESEP